MRAALLAESGLADAGGYDFRAGTGCGHCRGTGYKGRRAIAELLVLDDELREMIVTKEPVRRVKDVPTSNPVAKIRQSSSYS